MLGNLMHSLCWQHMSGAAERTDYMDGDHVWMKQETERGTIEDINMRQWTSRVGHVDHRTDMLEGTPLQTSARLLTTI